MPTDQNLLNDASVFDDPIVSGVHNKHKRRPSILNIKEKVKKCELFSFDHVKNSTKY